MKIKEKYKREWDSPHMVSRDGIEDGCYVKIRSNFTRQDDWRWHRWTEKWQPIKKEAIIDGQPVEVDAYIHTIIYEDHRIKEEESEFQVLDTKKLVETLSQIASAYAERGYKNKGYMKSAYKDIEEVGELKKSDALSWIRWTNRTID